MNVQHIDRRLNPPTIVVPHLNTAAWQVDMNNLEQQVPPKPHATVCAWIVFTPWAHPIWPYHLIICVHLRPVAGLPAPFIYLPGATHELNVMALDPVRVPNLRNPFSTRLTPMNFAAQFNVQTRLNPIDQDNEATVRVMRAIDKIMLRELNPDSDGLREWIGLFGSNMLKKG